MSAVDQWTKAVGGPIGVAFAVIGIAGAILLLGKQAKQAVVDTANAVKEVNKGTAYEGAGVVGTLGNVTNQASGGFFERIGSKIGGALADIADARRTKIAPEPTGYTPRVIAVKSDAEYYERNYGP